MDNILNIITWSDSCVPQNRNKIMSTAIIEFTLKNPRIKSVTMNYSVPSHSCIREVDNAHSQIEKHVKIDIWSPLSFVRSLLKVNSKKPFKGKVQLYKLCFKLFLSYLFCYLFVYHNHILKYTRCVSNTNICWCFGWPMLYS